MMLLVAAACASRPAAPTELAPPATDIVSRVYLVGDAGAPDPDGEPVLAALRADLAAVEAPAVVVFMGDNIYPAGLPPATASDRAVAEWRLRAQLEAAMQGGADQVIVVPGNHDWNYAGVDGLTRVREQEAFVEAMDRRIEFLPDDGCPGPVVRDVGTLRLLLIDTEWWLRKDGKPMGPQSSCATRTEGEIVQSIRSALADAADRRTIVIGHHPLATGGVHGGYFTFRQHVFPLTDLVPWLWVPLPVIGSAYPLARNLGITNQDLSGSRYRMLVDSMRSAFRAHPPLLYAAGHEHNLQLIEGGVAKYHVVSGSAIYGHVSDLHWLPDTRYAAERSGFVRLDVQRDHGIRLAFLVVDASGERTEAHAVFLDPVH